MAHPKLALPICAREFTCFAADMWGKGGHCKVPQHACSSLCIASRHHIHRHLSFSWKVWPNCASEKSVFDAQYRALLIANLDLQPNQRISAKLQCALKTA